jgi:type I restriction enzyme S subunit
MSRTVDSEISNFKSGSVPTSYKQTEVGVIPDDWDVKTLGSLANVVRGGSPRPAGDPRYFNGSFIPWLTVGALTNIPAEQLFVTDTATKLTEEGSQLSRTLEANTLVIVNSGARTLGVSKLLAMTCCANDGIAALTRQNAGEKRFLCYFLNSQIRRLRDVVAAGNDQLNLNTGRIALIAVPFPEETEQHAIADALSDVDGLLSGLDRLIAKKRDLKRAAMQQLLTGQTRLPGFHGQWEAVSMREVLTQNATYGIVTAGKFIQNGIKMLRGGDIVDGRINTDLPMVSSEKAVEYARTALLKDDVAIALVGYPGAAAKIPDELIGANISRAVGLLRTNDRVSADFLVCFLNSSDGRRMVLAPSAGSAQQVVNLAALNKLQFRIPSIPEQSSIAEVLTDMDADLAALEQRRNKTRDLKQAMMQELLTGKTRLV